jgi:hypothetical protein
MYAIISNLTRIPSVHSIGFDKNKLIKLMEEIAINFVIDNVGKNNWIDTLNSPQNFESFNFPVFPNYFLNRPSETEIGVSKVFKDKIIQHGWIYNSKKEIQKISHIGSFFLVPIENPLSSEPLIQKNNVSVDHYDLPVTNQKTIKKNKSSSTISNLIKRNFDEVIIDLSKNKTFHQKSLSL